MCSKVAPELFYQALSLSGTGQVLTVPSRSEMNQAKTSTGVRNIDHGLDRSCSRRSGLLTGFRVSCGKVVKRLMDGSCHFNELFAGNYMFMQVTPSPLGG